MALGGGQVASAAEPDDCAMARAFKVEFEGRRDRLEAWGLELDRIEAALAQGDHDPEARQSILAVYQEIQDQGVVGAPANSLSYGEAAALVRDYIGPSRQEQEGRMREALAALDQLNPVVASCPTEASPP